MQDSAMTSRRKFIRMAALGAVGTVVLAACSSAPATPTTAPAPTKTGDQPKPTVAATAAKSSTEPITLRSWLWNPDGLPILQQASDLVTKRLPNVKVNAESPADYWLKLQTAMAGGMAPDVFMMSRSNYIIWAAEGSLYQIDDRAAADPEIKEIRDNSWKDAWGWYDFHGKMYGLPYAYTTVVMYYDEGALKEAGLTPPAELKEKFTWNVLREYANKLTKREGTKTTYYGFHALEGQETGWLPFVRANGGDFFDKNSEKCIIDQPESVAAVQFLMDLALKDKVSPTPEALQAEPSRSLFMTRKIAMWPNGAWTMKPLNEQLKDIKYNIVIPAYSPTTGRSGGTTAPTCYTMYKQGKYLDESWELLKTLNSKEAQDIAGAIGTSCPVRMDSAEIFYDNKTHGPENRRAAFEVLNFTTPMPAHEKVTAAEISKVVNEWQTEMFTGRVGAEEGLKKMAVGVNELIAKVK